VRACNFNSTKMEIFEMSSTRVIRTNEVREEELSLKKTRNAQSYVEMLEYAAATGMFARYLSRGFRALNVGVSRFVFFPLIMLFQAVELGLVVNQARLENQLQGRIKSTTLAKFAVEAIVFAATTAAIIGGIVAPVLFAVATPALLVAGLGFKALYDFGSAVYSFARSFRTDLTDRERSAERYDAGKKFVSGLVNSAITIGLGLLAWTAAPLVATLFLGIGASVLGVAAAALVKHRRSRVALVETGSDVLYVLEPTTGPEESLSSTANLQRKLEVVYGLPLPTVVVPIIPAAKNVSLFKTPAAAAQRPLLTADPKGVHISPPTGSRMTVS
jgi:hypothetical protein